VEDVMADVELITLTLEAAGINFTYDTADTALTCQQRLRSQTYDAVLSEYRLSDYNSLLTLKILQESQQEIPLILVTGTLGEEAAVECINAGMTDYVLKQRLFRLPTVLARALQEFELRRQKKAAIAQIHASAWREAMINRIVQSVRGTLNVDEILQRTANQLHAVMPVSCYIICQPEPDCQIPACYISKASGEHQDLIAVNCDFSAYYGERLFRGELVVLDRIDSKLTPELQEAARGSGIRSLMMIPLLYQQCYLGEISLYQCDKEREWTADEMAVAIAVSEHCAIAIHQAHLYQQAQTELAERKRLEQVLRHQAEKLEQANRLKDQFLAIISHELRTPLSTILCWSQLLRSKKLNAAMIQRAMESIERSAKAQVKIVDDILDILRIIRDEIRLNNRPVDLVPMMGAIIDEIRPTAEAKELQLNSVLENSVDLIWGDPDRLKQILGHLLSNAIKFTPVGGRVAVRLSQELKVNRLQVEGLVQNSNLQNSNLQNSNPQPSNLQPSTPFVQIQVIDTGIGISPDFLPYVFERFRQADSTTTREYGGLGLGLAIVFHLVNLHGGTVHVASEGEGKGTTVTVQLPLLKKARYVPKKTND
jgi:signal transduction histidine kinase/DNA-binding response OmpR family regulator